MSSLTKILVVLQLVFSLVLAVTVVFVFSRIEPYRSELKSANDTANTAQVAAVRLEAESTAKDTQVTTAIANSAKAGTEYQKTILNLQDKITQLEIARNTAEAKADANTDAMTRLTATVDALGELIKNKDAEIAKLQPENVKLVTQNAELNRANNELSTQSRYAEMAIRKLQEQVAGNTDTKTSSINPAAAGNDAQVKNLSATPTNGPINGKITDARQASGRTLVELSLGERDGVQVNSKFTIYRGSSYIGDAVVDSVTPDKSVATVTILKPGQTVLRGDMVLSNNGQ